MTDTFWHGKPCKARIVKVVVGNSGRFKRPWFERHVGEVREAVEIVSPVDDPAERVWKGDTFYIDNEADDYSGWRKVTEGRGNPRWPSLSLDVERVVG